MTMGAGDTCQSNRMRPAVRVGAHETYGTIAARVRGSHEVSVVPPEGRGDAAVVHRQVGLGLDDLVRPAGPMDVDPGVVDRLLKAQAAVDEPCERLHDRGRDAVGAG